MNSFYTKEEIEKLGFKSIGKNVLISKNASFYGTHNMSLGSNVRIDDFCILSGKITIGSNVHISAYCALYGSFGIDMEDYTGISPRCTIFSASDDFSGNFLIGPMLPKDKTNVQGGKVYIKRFSQIGASSVVLPSVVINEGVAVGAMSLVNSDLEEWGIYVGVPAKRIKNRSRDMLMLMNDEK